MNRHSTVTMANGAAVVLFSPFPAPCLCKIFENNSIFFQPFFVVSISKHRSFCRLFYPTDAPSQQLDSSQYPTWLPSKDYARGYATFLGSDFSASLVSKLLNFLLGIGLCLVFFMNLIMIDKPNAHNILMVVGR